MKRFVNIRVPLQAAFVSGEAMKPAGLAVSWTRRPAKPRQGADAAAPSRHQATHRRAGFVVARRFARAPRIELAFGDFASGDMKASGWVSATRELRSVSTDRGRCRRQSLEWCRKAPSATVVPLNSE